VGLRLLAESMRLGRNPYSNRHIENTDRTYRTFDERKSAIACYAPLYVRRPGDHLPPHHDAWSLLLKQSSAFRRNPPAIYDAGWLCKRGRPFKTTTIRGTTYTVSHRAGKRSSENYIFYPIQLWTAAIVRYPTHMEDPTPAPTPRWQVDCRNCLQSFTHSYLGKSRNLEDYLHPTEPNFPAEGLELTCPRCETTAVYKLSNIRFYLK